MTTTGYNPPLTPPGQRNPNRLDGVTMEMLLSMHANPDMTTNITDIATVPQRHKELNGIVNDNNQIIPVPPLRPIPEFTNDELVKKIEPEDISDVDPYIDRDPRRFLNLRRFMLQRTIAYTETPEYQESLRQAENDMLTSLHLAETIARGVASRPAFSSAGTPGAKGSIDTDSTSTVTEYRRKVGEFTSRNTGRVLAEITEQPYKGMDVPTLNDEGWGEVIKHRGREAEFAPSTRAQERMAKKLVKARSKWRLEANEARVKADTFKPLTAEELRNRSKKDRDAYHKGREELHHMKHHEHHLRDKYVKMAYKPADKFQRVVAIPTIAAKKLERVEAAIATRNSLRDTRRATRRARRP